MTSWNIYVTKIKIPYKHLHKQNKLLYLPCSAKAQDQLYLHCGRSWELTASVHRLATLWTCLWGLARWRRLLWLGPLSCGSKSSKWGVEQWDALFSPLDQHGDEWPIVSELYKNKTAIKIYTEITWLIVCYIFTVLYYLWIHINTGHVPSYYEEVRGWKRKRNCVRACVHIHACVQSIKSLISTQTKQNKQLFAVTLHPLYATHQTTGRPHTHTHHICVLCIIFWQHTQRAIHRSSHLTNSNTLLFMCFYV